MDVLCGMRAARDWDVDVDRYLNRVVPASALHKLPFCVSRFLGYREVQRRDVGNVLGAVWSCVGAVCGLGVVAGVFNHMDSIQLHHPPALIASFGASAILEYNAVRSPLGQPRNAVLGHVFSALIGVGISKLFQYHSEYDSIQWVAGAVACGIASAVMLLTNTVHPPGGASAVLAATDPAITAMGWYFVGLVMWGTTLMVLVGLVVNNIQRQFPIYWWTPLDISKAKSRDEETVPDARDSEERKESTEEQGCGREEDWVRITGAEVILPCDLSLNAEEAQVLERLKERLRWRVDGMGSEEERDLDKLKVMSGRSSTEFTIAPSRSDGGRSGSTHRDM